ncbi:MAG TPA: TolC family protein [Limnobacter sp.]|nr:TolC family protein [Limnobacter sp.]
MDFMAISARLATALVASCCLVSNAQALTLSDLITELQKHPNVEAARQRLEAAEFDKSAADWQRYPALSYQQGAIGGGGQQSSIQLSQPLYTFGAIGKSIEAADLRRSSSESDVNNVHLAIVDLGIRTYLNALRHLERAEVNNRSVLEHEKLAEAMARRLEQQVGTLSDSQLASNRLTLAQADLFESKVQYERALEILANLIDRPVGHVNPVIAPHLPFDNEQAFLALAEEKSARISSLRASSQAQLKDADASRARLKPQVVLVAEEVQNNVPTDFRDSRLIAYLQYQPGAGLSALSSANALRRRAMAADSEARASVKELQQQVKQLWGEILVSSQLVEKLGSIQQSNREIVDSFYKQFQAGKRSWVDVLNGQRELTQSELSVVDNRYRLLTAQFQALSLINANTADKLASKPGRENVEPLPGLTINRQVKQDGWVVYEMQESPDKRSSNETP